ncbi:MAG: hypothetical protein ACYTG5_20705 [Planctomycetota bacterium]|jgi:hypothetical protein
MRAHATITLALLSLSAQSLNAQDFNPVGLDPEKAPCLSLGTAASLPGIPGLLWGIYIQRIDHEELRGWAWAEDPVDPVANPQGVHRVTGVKVLLADSGPRLATDIIATGGYIADAMGNLPLPLPAQGPDFNFPIPNPFMTPPGGQEVREVIVALGTPATFPAGRNVYMGVQFGSQAPVGTGPSVLGVDVGTCLSPPGPAPIRDGGYVSGFLSNSMPPVYLQNPAQLCLELYSENLGAKAISWPLPGIPDQTLYAGLHPDALNPSVNPNRKDTIGFQVMGESLDTDDLVFFFRGRGWAADPFPWRLFVPGMGGALTIDPFQAISALGVDRADPTGVAFLERQLSDPFRASTSFLEVFWFAVAIDEVTGDWQITPAVKQVLGVPPEGWR